MLLLLSHFSRVWLCATPKMTAHEAPPSLGFSRQEHWSGMTFPSPMHEVKSESEVAQSCLTLSDPMDCSLPGSSIHGIFQASAIKEPKYKVFDSKKGIRFLSPEPQDGRGGETQESGIIFLLFFSLSYCLNCPEVQAGQSRGCLRKHRW